MARLAVWLSDKLIGVLEQDVSGRMSFTYSSFKSPVSLSMPLREEPYDDTTCEAFFGGLLPESDTARQLIGKRFGVNGRNSFSLLRAIGRECAGAISILPEGEEPIAPSMLSLPKTLTESELASYIRNLPKRPLLAGVEGIRLSLAGAGDKAAVCLLDDKIALPPQGSPTTHILKPKLAEVGDTVANEFFCLRLAKRMGLTVAHVDLHQAEDIVFLLVERYDRQLNADLGLIRVHQEDFCQALGVVSARKYQAEGGPGYKDCFSVLERTSRPAVERMRFIQNMIFNYLIGNMDAHGKNYSLLYATSSRLTLAPLYDIVSTGIYSGLSTKLAMKVDKYYEPKDIFPRHWYRLCRDAGIAYPALRKEFLQMANKLPGLAETELGALKDAPGRQTYEQVVKLIDKNCQLIKDRFNRETMDDTTAN